MQRISVYLPEDTKRRIKIVSKAKTKSESEIIREALEKGLEKMYPKSASTQALLDFVKIMEKIPTKGKVPKDIIKNMDYYTWGGEKRT